MKELRGRIVKQRVCGKATTVQKLLARLGVSRHKLYRRERDHVRLGCFWQRPESVLLEFLQTARSRWKTLLKEHHPDKTGGSLREAAELNVAWERVKKLFKRRGLTLP